MEPEGDAQADRHVGDLSPIVDSVTPELARTRSVQPPVTPAARGFRLDAETVRDNALAISGLLNRKIGGPSVFPYQPDGVWANPYSGDQWMMSDNGDQYRRGLYTFWRRTAPYAAFMAFDAPSREVACERRPRTNTPLQALATLNDKVVCRMRERPGPAHDANEVKGDAGGASRIWVPLMREPQAEPNRSETS